ncbi:MAG: hypothetical protein LR015_09635 [Verrucomicrobia bacterium]|nr:hypothetical protein [Verrucomicrobiota bacterium]
MFIVVERLIALRKSKVIPAAIEEPFMRGNLPEDATLILWLAGLSGFIATASGTLNN